MLRQNFPGRIQRRRETVLQGLNKYIAALGAKLGTKELQKDKDKAALHVDKLAKAKVHFENTEKKFKAQA